MIEPVRNYSAASRGGCWGFLLAAVLLTGCWRGTSQPAAPTTPAAAKYYFVDAADEAGLQFQMNFLPNEQGATFKINLYDHGCGVAVGDCDGDGDDDLYLLNQLGPNRLFRNRGDGSFDDITEAAGVALADRISVGATFADYDNDGDQDLFVTSTRGGNTLFRNDGEERFVDATEEAGLTHVGHSQTAAFFDYDNDGWLDLYLAQTAEWTQDAYDDESGYYVGKGDLGSFADVLASQREQNILYRNDRNGKFTDVTQQSGLQATGWSGDVAVFDYDEDGRLDVLVTCMFGPAQLYHNEGGGKFANVTRDTLGRTPFGGIGAKVFDYNNDGRLDIYIVDMHSDMWMGVDFKHESLDLAKQNEKRKFDYFFGPYYYKSSQFRQEETRVQDLLGYNPDEVLYGNAFYENLGGGAFVERSAACNLETFWPWGVAAGDFDNDGFVDVFLPSGMGYPFYYWPNALLMNDGAGAFVDKSEEAGVEPPAEGRFLDQRIDGKECARSSRCAATADFDGDGQLEIIVNNFNHEPYYFKNRFEQQNYIALRLRGVESNRDAIGAVLKLTAGDATMVRQVQAAGGYLSQSSKTVHFGLGDRTAIDSIDIRWPSGRRQTLQGIEINRLHEVTEPGDSDSAPQADD